jgi:flavin reductase
MSPRVVAFPSPAAVAERRQRFLAGMSQAAATVSVVTTDGPAGRAGITVSAMSSVSADEPTLLVCIHHKSRAAAAILENGVFCVNVLRADQSLISDHFAGRDPAVADRFACAEWTRQVTGAPRLVDPLVGFDCRLTTHHRVGTHHVFFGAVEDVFIAEGGAPLIYLRRAYAVPA